jgi:SAM-dependent methyltransferase
MCRVDIDWNEVWKIRMFRHIESSGGQDCAGYFEDEGEARDYWKNSQENDQRAQHLCRALGISPGFRILDIGAGPGTLAVPLAKVVSHITAVEPSSAMMNVLRENIENYGLSNIDCLQKRWEDVNVKSDLPCPYDLVMASFSLGMKDIKEAIRKMVAASCGKVALLWFAGEPSWETHCRRLWPRLHGREYYPMPHSDVLFNILYRMGIYANVAAFSWEFSQSFSNLDDASAYWCQQMQVTADDKRSVVRNYLRELAGPGQPTFKDFSQNMLIWWDVNQINIER